MEFVISCLRTLFFTLDTIVFGLIDDVYGLLMQISRTTIFDQDALHSFSQRVYVMLGLFMLLKVMISIVNYIINPDDLVDKEKGFANVIKRIILSLVMIVLVPYIFREAYELQAIVLSENTIMSIVFGSPGENYRTESNTARSNSSFYDTAGKKIQFTIMYAFAQPNYEEYTATDIDLSDCRQTYQVDKNGNFVFREKNTSGGKKTGKSNYIYALNESCFGTYNASNDSYEKNGDNGQLLRLIEEKINDGTTTKYYQNYAQGVAQQNFSLFFRKPIILAKTTDEGKYAINYKWGVSTAVGVATVYLLLIFCIDIAGRSIKLGFLQLISPIPILSYCDPKSSKDGMFKKWYTMCFKAYAELFIKLFALYFGIYIISLVGTFKDVMTGEAVDNWLVSIFMIIGVLIFVKKLPEIIKDALGVDLGGKLELNPLKKLENDVAGGKILSGAGKKGLGLATGVAAGTTAAAAGLVTGQGIHRKTFTNALKGGLHGDKFGKNFASSYGAGKERHKQLQEMRADGVKPRQVSFEKLRTTFGGESNATRVQNLANQGKAIQTAYDAIKNQITACDTNEGALTYTDQNGRIHTTSARSAKTISKYLDELKKTSIDRESFRSQAVAKAGATGNVEDELNKLYNDAVDNQRKSIMAVEKELEERINAVSNRVKNGYSTGVASADKIINEQVSTMESLVKSSNSLGKSIDSDFATIDESLFGDDGNDIVMAMKQAKGTVSQASSGKIQHAADVSKYANSGKK